MPCFIETPISGYPRRYGAPSRSARPAPLSELDGRIQSVCRQIGDYAVIIGNPGGDNRVEFGTRLDHSISYESPNLAGFHYNLLFSPGQNRGNTSADDAAGESDCAGGNGPSSDGNFPVACNDGAFSNVISTNLSFTNGPFYAAAYERHFKVNRQSDISTGIFGVTNPVDAANTECLQNQSGNGGNPVNNLPKDALALFNADVADEDAFKVGALYRFPTTTTIGSIFESFHRARAGIPEPAPAKRYLAVLEPRPHRPRAHPFKTPANPGQHNSATRSQPPTGRWGLSPPTTTDMVTAS